MAEITVADLTNTYIKLSKPANCYESPEAGDKGSPVWFTKSAGDIGGKLFSWIEKNPGSGKKYKRLYLMFKVNDDFNNTNAKAYFIPVSKGMINWEYTRQQLIAKAQINMSAFDKFVDDIERNIQEWADGVVAYAKSGLITGLSIVAGVLLFNFVIIPELKFRRLKSTAKELIKEAKR